MSSLPRAKGALTIASFDRSLSAGPCDLRNLSFIDAYGLVATACALRAASAERATVLLPEPPQVRAHLASMGLREFLDAAGITNSLPAAPVAAMPDVVVPLTSTTEHGGAQQLSALLWKQLEPQVSPQVLETLTEGVWEMVANAHEHAGEHARAMVMGQVYRRPRGRPPEHDDRVQIVIGDAGRGIRRSFLEAGAEDLATDAEAIEHALEYLVTSTGDPGRGQGLSTTLEQVVGVAGRMVVRSGDARVIVSGEGRKREKVPPLPGVIVALSLPIYP